MLACRAPAGARLDEPTPVKTGPRRTLLALAALTLLGGLLRLHFASYPVRPIGDEVYYFEVARSLALGEGHAGQNSRALRPPAHPWLLSCVFDTDLGAEAALADQVRPLLRLQVALGTLLIALTGWFAWRLFGPVAALAAAAMAALYPTLIAYSHYLWSETFFSVVMLAGLLLVVEVARTWSAWQALLAGALFGVGTLTREVALPVALLCALWWLWMAPSGRRAVALARGAGMLVCCLALVAPWTYRNYRVLGRFVPVASIGWLAMREGNTLPAGSWLHPDPEGLREWRRLYFAMDEMEAADRAKEETLERIRQEQPLWILKKLVRTTALLLTPDSYIFKKLSRDGYGEVRLGGVRAVLVATILSYLAVVVLGVIGLASRPGKGRVLLPVLVLAAVFGLHLVANSASRFRVPWMPLVMVYAGHAVASWRTIPHVIRGRRRAFLALGLIAVLGGCTLYFLPDAAALWEKGTYVDPSRP